MGAHPLYGALSHRGLLDPIKPAYNQSRLDGRLKLTASAFNQLRISMQAVLVALPTVMQNLLHPTTTFSIIAHHLLDFMVQGKITGRCTDNPFGHHPIWIIDAPTPYHPPIFTLNALSATTLSHLSWLGAGIK